jgi:hypothetical protein
MADFARKLTLSEDQLGAMDQADELRKKAGTDNPSSFDIARVSGVAGSAAPEAKEFVSNLEKEATLKNQQDLKDEAIAAQKQMQEDRLAQQVEELKQRALDRKAMRDASSSSKELGLEQKKYQWTEDQWQKLERRTNALNTSGRSALGQSGVANVRAARAMDVLVNKDIVQDPYAYDLVNTDVQGIMKGAAPTQEQLKEKYTNLQTALASQWQKITAQPQSINQPEVKKQLLTIINSLREIDNDVIDRNLGVAKVAFKHIIQDDPDRAEEFFNAISQTKDVFPENVPGAKQAGTYTSGANAEAAKKKYGISY